MSLSRRTTRKSEALTSSSGNTIAMAPGVNHNLGSYTHTYSHSNINGRKRARESADSDDHLLSKAKKSKLSIEIPAPKLKSLPPRKRSGVIKSNANPDSANSVQHPQIATTADVRTAHPPSQNSQQQQQQQQQRQPPPPPTKHQNKVANGIKHELDRLQDKLLQADKADLKDERRKLRSQEGTKFKSELSAYFPEYDEVIGNVPKEEHFLDVDTPIIIIDSSKPSSKPLRTSKKKESNTEYAVKDYPSSLFTNLHGTHKVDFSEFTPMDCDEDPLSEEHFKTLHKRPERQEKAVRNADKSRAQHERDSVIRLMEGLQGPDWLKTLGVSGITEGRKKEFESARQYFVKGCESILEKFRIWKDDEKQRKLKKERAIAEAQARAEAESEEGEDSEDDLESNGDPPDLSDIDASAARQLHDEAIASSTPRPKARTNSVLVGAPVVEKEFKSFFAKPYLREAALGKHRRSGRTVAAWGHPVPELPEVAEFDLPEEFLDEETLKSHARKKRRDRRIAKD